MDPEDPAGKKTRRGRFWSSSGSRKEFGLAAAELDPICKNWIFLITELDFCPSWAQSGRSLPRLKVEQIDFGFVESSLGITELRCSSLWACEPRRPTLPASRADSALSHEQGFAFAGEVARQGKVLSSTRCVSLPGKAKQCLAKDPNMSLTATSPR